MQDTKDGKRRQVTASDGERRRATASYGKRRQATASDGERWQATASDGERRQRRRATASDGERRRATASDGAQHGGVYFLMPVFNAPVLVWNVRRRGDAADVAVAIRRFFLLIASMILSAEADSGFLMTAGGAMGPTESSLAPASRRARWTLLLLVPVSASLMALSPLRSS